jgi:hypothetical protein
MGAKTRTGTRWPSKRAREGAEVAADKVSALLQSRGRVFADACMPKVNEGAMSYAWRNSAYM